MAFASCASYEAGYFTAYRRMADDRPDLILHLGDYIYEYGATPGAVREHAGATEIVSLADYRRRYAQYKSDPDLQAAHAVAPWLVVPDDHEVENNYANMVRADSTPALTAEQWAARRTAAYRPTTRTRRCARPQRRPATASRSTGGCGGGSSRRSTCSTRASSATISYSDPDSATIDTELVCTSITSDGDGTAITTVPYGASNPQRLLHFAGDLAVAWESDHTGAAGVWTRSFTPAGSARQAEVEASSGAGAGSPTVGLDDSADAVVGWTVAGVDGWARGFNPDGTDAGRLPAQTLT